MKPEQNIHFFTNMYGLVHWLSWEIHKSKAQSHLLLSWLAWNIVLLCVMLSCSLSGWRVAVLHPQLDHK